MQASTSPYMPAIAGHTASQFSPYLSPSPMIPAGMMPADALAAPPPPHQLTSIVHTPIVTQKVPRTDRLEVRNISFFLSNYPLFLLFQVLNLASSLLNFPFSENEVVKKLKSLIFIHKMQYFYNFYKITHLGILCYKF